MVPLGLPRVNQKIAVSVVYISGMLLNSLDSTIVNVALATLARDFHVSPDAIDSVVIGYLASLAVFIPVSGWLGDRFGTKRTLLLSLALFTIASALCGLAQSLDQLVLFRVLQGAGGGLLTPVGMTMLYRTFPPAERVGVGRVLMFATILGPALGPILGGFLIQHASWRWAFYVNVPVGTAAFFFGIFFLHEHREAEPGRFDLAGFLLGSVGFGLTMFGLMEGPSRGWSTPVILGSLAVGIATMVAFVLVELRTSIPMIQLRLLGNALFRSTLIVSLCASAAFLSVLFLVPLFLQEAMGVSPLGSGLTTFPEAIGVVASTQLVAKLYPHIGPRRLMFGGLLLVAASIGGLCLVDLNSSLWTIRILMFFLGVGMAYIFLPNQAASLATISSEMTGRASTLSNIQRRLGASIGVAVASTALGIVGAVKLGGGGEMVPNLAAYRVAFMTAAGLALLGAVFALVVPDRDAANTMVVPEGKRGRRTVRVEPAKAD